MLKNKIILLIIIISITLLIFGVYLCLIEKSSENELVNSIEEKLKIVLSGDCLKANFEFVDNYENKKIANNYLNMPKEDLIKNGYVEYIQSSDYMIEFYSKVTIKEISIKQETENEVICLIIANRPNLSEIMDECDKENADNASYDFNKEFINKLKLNDFKKYEGTFEITLKKLENQIKFKYDGNFKEMLYC